MSALTTASLRDAMLEAVDSLADASLSTTPGGADDAAVSARLVSDDNRIARDSEPSPPLSLDEAVDRAVARLKAAGELDAATQATLLSILESTQPEDWPAAIDVFTAALEKHRPAPQPVAALQIVATPAPSTAESRTSGAAEELVFPVAFPVPAVPSSEVSESSPPTIATGSSPSDDDPLRLEPARLAVVAAARPVVPDPLPEVFPAPLPDPLPGQSSDLLPDPLLDLPAPVEPPTPPAPAPEPPAAVAPAPQPLAVHNACFASRVRAWGVVDRFPAAVFRPGQDVIVYFELDALAARPAAAGHATSIDTLFRLVGPDGRQLGQWDFEPIDEICHAPRRDYFARYILRIPEGVSPGHYRLEFVVTDLVAGTSVPAHLDLEIR